MTKLKKATGTRFIRAKRHPMNYWQYGVACPVLSDRHPSVNKEYHESWYGKSMLLDRRTWLICGVKLRIWHSMILCFHATVFPRMSRNTLLFCLRHLFARHSEPFGAIWSVGSLGSSAYHLKQGCCLGWKGAPYGWNVGSKSENSHTLNFCNEGNILLQGCQYWCVRKSWLCWLPWFQGRCCGASAARWNGLPKRWGLLWMVGIAWNRLVSHGSSQKSS